MFPKFKRGQKLPNHAFEAFEPYQIDIDEHELTIRRALLSDISSLVAIQEAVYDGYAPWVSQDFLRELSRPKDRIYLVVERLGQLVGFMGVVFRPLAADVHISNIAVLPVWQSRGIGRQLLEAAKQLARMAEVGHLTLEVRKSNEGAQKLYQRQGFVFTDLMVKYYFDNHEDALSMSLFLENPSSNN